VRPLEIFGHSTIIIGIQLVDSTSVHPYDRHGY
jgi:hypothetical protein